MLENYCNAFIEKSNENYKLYEFLKSNGAFIDWQIVSIFYSALCLAKAYLYSKNIPLNSINSHDNIKYYLATETNAKRSNVLLYYNNLYRNSRDARYTTKKMTQGRLNTCLIDYVKVKELLKITFDD